MAKRRPDSASLLEAETSRRNFLKANLTIGGGLLLAGGAGPLLAACGSSDPGKTGPAVTTSDVANATGSVTALAFSFYQAKELNAGRVKAKFASIASVDELTAKLRSKSTKLDVANTGANIMEEMYALERLAPIPVDALPGYQNIDADLRNDPIFSRNGEVYAIPFAVTPGLTCWDSGRADEPTTAEDLLKPAYRKRIGVSDGSGSILGFHRMLHGHVTPFSKKELKETLDFMKELKPNIRTFYGFGQESALFGQNEIDISVVSYGSLLAATRKVNKDVKANFLGSMSYVDTWSVVKGADMPKALSWISQSLTPAGQAALQVASGGYPSVGADLDTSLLPAELKDTTLADLRKLSPVNSGTPVKGDGATSTDVQRAWADFKAGF